MDTVSRDRQGLEVLDPDTCRRLLDLSPVGRVGYVHAGEPMVLPVNHVRDGHGIVFRTATGSTLDAASRREPMAFEVDGYDEVTMTGWSVLVRGRSDLVTDDDEVERLEAMDLHPWASDVDRPNWVRIGGTTISGRRISEGPSGGRTAGR